MAAEGLDMSSNGDVSSELETPVPPEVMPADQPELPQPPQPESSQPEETAEHTAETQDTSGAAPYPTALEEGDDEEGELPVDFDRLWRVAHDNPQEFSSWTDLLQYCEQESHTTASRRALGAFLVRYPLCYGYWKKFADLERRAGNSIRAQEVCVRGLKAIPLSLDLWIHYITLLQDTLNMNLPESTQHIRSAFEAAVAAAGLEFHSDRLWEMYADWEREQGDLRAVTAIYGRVMRIPTQLYRGHFERVRAHLFAHPPKDLLPPEEFKRLRAEFQQSQQVETAPVEGEESEEKPPGEETPEESNTKDQDTEEDVQKMQELLLADRQKLYQQTELEVGKRWAFEEAIKRPYFHVKPLDRAQLKAWHAYLDWEMSEAEQRVAEAEDDGSRAGRKRVLVLFERCLIACALYEELWTKYVRFLEQHSVEEAQAVYRRACEVHLSHKPSMHLQWATFEERHGNITEARRVLKSLEEAMPGLAMVRLRRAGLERRTGRLDQAEELLREAVLQSTETPTLHAFYSIKLARLLLKLSKNSAKARSVLLEAIELCPDNSKLHLNLLELEVAGDPRGNGIGVQQCVSRALAAPLSPHTKLLFSQRGLQFAEDFGATVQSVLTVYDEHQKLLKELGSKKRGAENGDNDDPEKMSKLEESVPAPSMATPPMPPVAMATPPPPMMGGDMSGSHYGYGGWYQHQQYGAYGYQNPWNYNQYYPPS
ncbi:pre-mRNA-processing factor 39 [Paramormyrops kingsleyae]|uniref:Pre-mRNA-processing factor 39-like n=1 Tax=Paramormyrops kingsleyae TaxID=1676925 RepID=A0A3B3Q7W2_9TELE|nr:pre-mRNA-processing factor 39-like [Paramormyrops kingsleyae]